MNRFSSLWITSFAVATFLAACGGGAPKPATGPEAHSSDDSSESSSGSAGSSEEPENRGPDCSDGTCFTCGSGMCPSGFYCDQDANGGPACSWLPECAGKSSCECIQRGLGSGCSCDARDGGFYVSCK